MGGFNIGDIVQIGSQGERGKIIDIYKPLGTYPMYKVHVMSNGVIKTAARHELIKGMPDEDFQDLWTAVEMRPLNLNGLFMELDPEISTTSTEITGDRDIMNLINQNENNEDINIHVDTQNSNPVNRVESALTEPNMSSLDRSHTNDDNQPNIETDLQNYMDYLNNLRADDILTSINKNSTKEKPVHARNEPTASNFMINNNSRTYETPNKARFPELETTVEEFLDINKNENTKRKTLCHQKLLEDYLTEKQEYRNIHEIDPEELNGYLCEFILRVRQRDGKEYEPTTLRSIISSLDRYLKEHNYQTSIVRGIPFRQTMTVLANKGKDLKKQGKGNKPMAANILTDKEIDLLYANGQLGNDSPNSLINRLWLNNTLHFGMRGGGNEHRQLMWGDVELRYDSELNSRYLEYNERQTKTRTGIDINNIRPEKPRMYETGDERCPILTYMTYKEKRPENFSNPMDPFYLACNTKTKNPLPGQTWFLKGPVGKNKLNNLMKTMATRANLPDLENGKRLTNTSVRKALCQKLLNANVPDTQAIHVTGHKNAQSLNNYRQLSNFQQAKLSNLLASKSSSLPEPPTFLEDQNQTVSFSQTTTKTVKQQATRCQDQPVFFPQAVINGGTFNITVKSNGLHKRKYASSESESDSQ